MKKLLLLFMLIAMSLFAQESVIDVTYTDNETEPLYLRGLVPTAIVLSSTWTGSGDDLLRFAVAVDTTGYSADSTVMKEIYYNDTLYTSLATEDKALVLDDELFDVVRTRQLYWYFQILGDSVQASAREIKLLVK